MFKGKKKNYKILGICTAEVQNEIERKVVFSISKEAVKRGYKVFMFNAFTNMYVENAYQKGESSVYKLVNAELLDILVVMPEAIKNESVVEEIISDALSVNLPVVVFDKDYDGCKSVHFNYADNFEKLVRHVVEDHKCRVVNMIGGMRNNPFSDSRIDTYKKVLKENGIEVDERRIGYGDFWDRPTREAIKIFFESGLEVPEAIVCANDSMAIATQQELKKRGYRVPEDIIVTGFDGVELEQYVTPRLTTAAPDYESMGKAILDVADGIINNVPVADRTEVMYNMRVSQSCGCVPTNYEDVCDRIIDMYNLMDESDGHEVHMFSYVSKVIDCNTPEEIAYTMSRYADDNSWCCINTDCFTDIREPYRYKKCFTAKMNNIMKCENGDFSVGKTFNTKELIPDIESEFEKYNCFMFSPIHYQSDVFGYIIVTFDTENIIFNNTRRFLNNTNQIIENFRNKFILEQAKSLLESMYIRDYMTGIYNRRGFYENAQTLIDTCNKNKHNIVIFSVDMDGMKLINDTYGHNEGDKAIIGVAHALRAISENGEICARFGGDEFIIIGEETDKDYAQRFVNALNEEIEYFNDSDLDRPYKVVVSCGYVSAKCSDNDDVYEKIRIADERMYIQKREHKAEAK